jgi:hypothetical protein
MIVDANGNQVPDGTPVEFTLNFQGENFPALDLATITFNGRAQVTVTLDRPGVINIGAESSTARVSELKQITVQGEFIEQTQVAPLGSETLVVDPSQTIEAAPSPIDDGIGNAEGNGEELSTFQAAEFILGLLGNFIIAGIGYSIASVRFPDNSNRLRYAFITSIGALLGYNYLALGFPGSEDIFNQLGQITSLLSSIVGGAIALIVALILVRRGEVG